MYGWHSLLLAAATNTCLVLIFGLPIASAVAWDKDFIKIKKKFS